MQIKTEIIRRIVDEETGCYISVAPQLEMIQIESPSEHWGKVSLALPSELAVALAEAIFAATGES